MFSAGLSATSLSESTNAGIKSAVKPSRGVVAVSESLEMMQVQAIEGVGKLVKVGHDSHPFLQCFGGILGPNALRLLRERIARTAGYRVEAQPASDHSIQSFYVWHPNNPDSTRHVVRIEPLEKDGESDGPAIDVRNFGGGQSCVDKTRPTIPERTSSGPLGYPGDALDSPSFCPSSFCAVCQTALGELGESFHFRGFIMARNCEGQLAAADLTTYIKSHGYCYSGRPMTLSDAHAYVQLINQQKPVELKSFDVASPPRTSGRGITSLIITCAKCSVRYHALCAGVQKKPKKLWTCLACLYPR